MIYTNRKRLVKIFILLTIVFQFSVSLYSAEAKKVDIRKVEKFILEMEKLGKEGVSSTKETQISKRADSLDLTDDEYIEVQRIISEQVNLLVDDRNKLSDDDVNKVLYVLRTAKNKLLSRWKRTLTHEQIIMTKVMPIIKNSPNRLKAIWLNNLDNALCDITNQKLSFADNNRATVMNELIKLFSDKRNPLYIREAAARAWINGEERREKINTGFDILVQDEKVFEKVGTLIWFFTNGSPEIYEKMFDILENKGKYPDGVIEGALEFFKRDCISFHNDTGGRRKSWLINVLKQQISKENKSALKEKYQETLNEIDLYEKIQKLEKSGGQK